MISLSSVGTLSSLLRRSFFISVSSPFSHSRWSNRYRSDYSADILLAVEQKQSHYDRKLRNSWVDEITKSSLSSLSSQLPDVHLLIVSAGSTRTTCICIIFTRTAWWNPPEGNTKFLYTVSACPPGQCRRAQIKSKESLDPVFMHHTKDE